MTLDLGVRRRARLTPAQKLVIAAAIAATVALPVYVYRGAYLRDREEALTLAREWAISGPPCPSLSRAEFEARGLKVTRGLVYEDAIFYREFGHISCTGLRHASGWSQRLYPVCQFTSPKALRVTSGDRDWYFAPGPGQPATVSVRDGQARCVLAANFTIRNLVGAR